MDTVILWLKAVLEKGVPAEALTAIVALVAIVAGLTEFVKNAFALTGWRVIAVAAGWSAGLNVITFSGAHILDGAHFGSLLVAIAMVTAMAVGGYNVVTRVARK